MDRFLDALDRAAREVYGCKEGPRTLHVTVELQDRKARHSSVAFHLRLVGPEVYVNDLSDGGSGQVLAVRVEEVKS